MEAANVYKTINKEIFSDPFYNFCKTDNKRLLAWFFLNVLSFNEEDIQSAIIEDNGHDYIDLMLFDNKRGVVYVGASTFISIYENADFLSFSRQYNFFRYIINYKEFNFTSNLDLDRKVFYLTDCIKRGYKLKFIYLTSGIFNEKFINKSTETKEKAARDSDLDIDIEFIDMSMLCKMYDDADSIDKTVNENFNQEAQLDDGVAFIADELSMEEKRALYLCKESLKTLWTEKELSKFTKEPEKDKDRIISLSLYTIFQSFCVFNRIKRDLMPSICAVYFNIERLFYYKEIFLLCLQWMESAYALAKKRDKKVSFLQWSSSEIFFYDIRRNLENYFSDDSNLSVDYSANLFFSKLFQIPNSIFYLKINPAFLKNENDGKFVSISDRFLKLLKEKEINEDDKIVVEDLIRTLTIKWSEQFNSNEEIKIYKDEVIIMSALSIFGCFTYANKAKSELLPGFASSIAKLKESYLMDEFIKTIQKCIILKIEEKKKQFNNNELYIRTWLKSEQCYYDIIKEISNYFNLLKMMPGDMNKFVKQYYDTLKTKNKDFFFHINPEAFLKI